ncbi:MAG: glycosyltransferase family 4 protein [Candidatus Nanoarchaeia archaeon]|jgi:glycosyltransferase involved in cell wall biosynthesis
MKITQFCQLYPPAIYGGGEYLFFQYAKELAKRGHEVNVITQRLKGTKCYEELNGVKIHRVGKPIDYKGHLNMSLMNNASFIIKSFKKGLKIAKDSDIIHSNTYAPALSGHAVSYCLKIPHVISIFDVYSQGSFWNNWSGQRGVSKGLSIIGPLMEKIILKIRPAMIHTISNASKEDLIKAGVKRPIRVVPCMIDLTDYKTPRTEEKNQFCYVGRHVFYKNVDTIIKAMPSVLGKNPKTKFIIVGDGPMKKQWMALARRLGVSSSVLFTGRVSHEHKLRIINESKFVVNPSTVEGFGIIILESWALGKPVIASNVRPMNELINKENGDLAEPYKSIDWANKINKMLKENKQGIKKYAKQYSTKKVTPLLENIFKTLI